MYDPSGPFSASSWPCYVAEMGRSLAIFHGAADDESTNELSAEQQRESMRAWAAWAQANQDALFDPGAPLFMKKMITAQGVEDSLTPRSPTRSWRPAHTTRRCGFFSEHPHLELLRGSSIEVLECPPVPAG